ncbi:hypothetical protein PSm6_56430 [Pseudomonas solani]|uniref:Uncharacterized protein n=1 Tax=Pseudomonas solani TaxID=2731552 RepID=A0ABN6C2S5_9PSED|nr:hypothetical protein PSm6_56430 [Pseudomonas solani]
MQLQSMGFAELYPSYGPPRHTGLWVGRFPAGPFFAMPPAPKPPERAYHERRNAYPPFQQNEDLPA